MTPSAGICTLGRFGFAKQGGSNIRVLTGVLVLAATVAGGQPATASASDLVDRGAKNVRLQVDAGGRALLSYDASGRRRHVLAWGALNALHPTAARAQVTFRLDYSGGWGTQRKHVWKTFQNACRPYDGPRLHWLVTACKAPDGSYWAVQTWQRGLPNYGGRSAARELRLSHWAGPLPVLTIHQNWAYRRYHHLFGSLTYRGRPVYGFRHTSGGAPLDTFGRNLYVDTLDSAYGRGWRRENGFLAQRGSGKFCYGFYPHGGRPSGMGRRYRATVIGPGVLPDIRWEAPSPGAYDAAFDQRMESVQRQWWAGVSTPCKVV